MGFGAFLKLNIWKLKTDERLSSTVAAAQAAALPLQR